MEENLIPARISPPRIEAHVYIALDGGDWAAGHEANYLIAQGDVDQVMAWMRENVPGFDEDDEQAARKWVKQTEEEVV